MDISIHLKVQSAQLSELPVEMSLSSFFVMIKSDSKEDKNLYIEMIPMIEVKGGSDGDKLAPNQFGSPFYLIASSLCVKRGSTEV
jgi:hypothetical protein